MTGNWFIALPVAAGEWFHALTPPPGVRLFGANDLHLTIAFLGAVGEERAHAAFALAAGFPLSARRVQLGPVEALGSPRRPSAISALLAEGRTEVELAMGAARAGMWEAAAARPDSRSPLAHVTFARPGRRASTSERKHALAWAKALDLGAPTCELTRIALYTWSEDRAASLFRSVSELPLPAA
jgi:2'-5' RNA ligase